MSAADRGNYTCVATSSQQGTISATIVIGVVVAPRFVVAPVGPTQQVKEMSSLWLHCQATGDPKPTIQWDKDLEYISSGVTLTTTTNSNDVDGINEANRFVVMDNGTLYIREVHLDDEGRYGCTIGSSAGLKREEVLLTVKCKYIFITFKSKIILKSSC